MKAIKNFISKITETFKNKVSHSLYSRMSVQNRYPCLFIGEKHLYDNKPTVIRYIIKSKRDIVYEININEFLNDPLLIEKFHPTQAVKIGCIAMGDILSSIPEEEIEQKYKSIMESMLKIKK